MKIKEYLNNCNEIYHTTLDPKGVGVVRIHLIPPKKKKLGVPWVVVLNGYSVLPLETSWAVLLKEFISELNKTKGDELTSEDIDELISNTTIEVKKVFPSVTKTIIKEDLKEIIYTIRDVAKGIAPKTKIGYMTLSKYSRNMEAPHRMDLMISSMEKNGKWNCNQNCIHCYACGEKMAKVKELSTEEWKRVIDICKYKTPSLTFTGGEPTIRDDLCELINHASWFVTRLNTNGILLSKKLCQDLYQASLDSVQVTLYSHDPKIHNELVGGNHFQDTIQGIKNALDANLDLSINTPLCSINKNYIALIDFASKLGVRYFSCSGLIPTGSAKDEQSEITKLTSEEILVVVKEAYKFVKENQLEITFTSPGWIAEEELKKMKMITPSCGACLSNMAIAPNGEVLPCQSWLFDEGLGNILTNRWKDIWESKKCKTQRKYSSKNTQKCPLKEVR